MTTPVDTEPKDRTMVTAERYRNPLGYSDGIARTDPDPFVF